MSRDKINPSHYEGKNGMQSIDIIEEFNLDFNLGNVIKYVLRHRNKNGLEDLEKASWYLERAIVHYKDVKDE